MHTMAREKEVDALTAQQKLIECSQNQAAGGGRGGATAMIKSQSCLPFPSYIQQQHIAALAAQTGADGKHAADESLSPLKGPVK